MSNVFKKFTTWYFSKKVLPYWVILLADTVIVFLSAVFIYWVSENSLITFEHRQSLFFSALLYSMLSWVGARIFRTYSGVLRFSSFVDLLKIAYANLVSMGLALLVSIGSDLLNVEIISALNPYQTVFTFLFAMLVMWASRVLVKLVYDSANTDSDTMRVLIYGALTGGIGLAKSIRSESPARFELVGFISHEHRIKNMKLVGVRVYSLEDDIAHIIRKERIQAVLVSPLRVNEFRENQKIQDIIIGAGCKIFMSHEAEEAKVRNGELADEKDDVQLKEVSVEDLLPRNEIRVDMKSVGEILAGKRILITGSAGSIGLEIVRQIAQFKPARMMLIDQAETPQHDVRLMMAKDFPDVPCEVVVTSISRRTRMEYIFSSFKPEYVFHAAAYKHVPMMEDNPSEAILNNVYGTKVIADMSVKYGVKKFVMISTDKAVNPTNVMGCSKRICEIYVQSLDRKLKLDALEKARSGGRK
ncbi:MAG: polysaccharide biosynthesis protein, partial [Bacteroidales bacterium]|nr:polysaccharide biosynthesis protein [Bacteroidales bacterium]